jgi:tetratricopeptide (TPR) repeat protein
MTPQQQADLQVARGNKALEIKRYQEAERSARDALAFVPSHHDAFVLLARATIAQGRYDAALEVTERTVSTDPGDAYGHYLRGMCFELLAKYAEAEPYLRKAVELDSNDGVYHARLAMALAGQKKSDEARRAVDEALARGGTHWLVLDLCFLALMRTEETAKAIEIGETLRSMRPDIVEPHRRLAWAYNLAKRHEDAAVSARKAIAIAPNDADAWFELGYAMALLKSPDEALAAYRESVRIRPKQPVVYENIAKLLREKGEYETAEVELVKGLAQSPSNKTLDGLLQSTRATLAERRKAKAEAAEREERARVEREAAEEREKLDRESRARAQKSESAKSEEAVSEELKAALARAEALRKAADEEALEVKKRKESAKAEAIAKGELPPALAEAKRREEQKALAERQDRSLGLWFFLALALVAAVLFVRGC